MSSQNIEQLAYDAESAVEQRDAVVDLEVVAQVLVRRNVLVVVPQKVWCVEDATEEIDLCLLDKQLADDFVELFLGAVDATFGGQFLRQVAGHFKRLEDFALEHKELGRLGHGVRQRKLLLYLQRAKSHAVEADWALRVGFAVKDKVERVETVVHLTLRHWRRGEFLQLGEGCALFQRSQAPKHNAAVVKLKEKKGES